MQNLSNARSQNGQGKVSSNRFISPMLLQSKFHVSSDFSADVKISKGREGGMTIYTLLPAVPSKRPSESVQRTPLLPGDCIMKEPGVVL